MKTIVGRLTSAVVPLLTRMLVMASLAAIATVPTGCMSPPSGDLPALDGPASPDKPQTEPPPQSPAPVPTQQVPTIDVSWSSSLESLETEPPVGARITFRLPPAGERNALWGSYVYTSDSSIGTAAVHAGLITFAGGGVVTVEVAPGRAYYLGSQMNGVESSSYSAWNLSFVFLRNSQVVRNPDFDMIPWDMNSIVFPEGVDITLRLPPGGDAYPVWGTDIYTSDSSIGTAAVHAGLITFAGGGVVTFRKVGPSESYRGSVRNGVTTSSYGSWDQSFVFVW